MNVVCLFDLLFVACVTDIQSHVCILQKRPDVTNRGILRWSLPDEERCLCHSVVTLHASLTNLCPSQIKNVTSLWFVDDARLLIRRQNWNKIKLDKLLDRKNNCGKLLVFCYTIWYYFKNNKNKCFIHRTRSHFV